MHDVTFTLFGSFEKVLNFKPITIQTKNYFLLYLLLTLLHFVFSTPSLFFILFLFRIFSSWKLQSNDKKETRKEIHHQWYMTMALKKKIIANSKPQATIFMVPDEPRNCASKWNWNALLFLSYISDSDFTWTRFCLVRVCKRIRN